MNGHCRLHSSVLHAYMALEEFGLVVYSFGQVKSIWHLPAWTSWSKS